MPDAPPTPPPDAPPPTDASVADATAPDAKKDAISTHQAHPDARTGSGELFVTTMPIMTVWVDGKRYGDAPVTIPLKAGPHKLKLTNESGTVENIPITITANHKTTIQRPQ